MTRPAKCGKRHSDRAGFSLGEWALVLACGAVIFAVAGGSAACRMDQARAWRTLDDMRAILEASQQYYAAHGAWPFDVQEAGAFLVTIPSGNAWGREYTFAHGGARSWIETRVPEGISIPAGKWPMVLVSGSGSASGGQVVWRMVVPLSYGSTARLVYERK